MADLEMSSATHSKDVQVCTANLAWLSMHLNLDHIGSTRSVPGNTAQLVSLGRPKTPLTWKHSLRTMYRLMDRNKGDTLN